MSGLKTWNVGLLDEFFSPEDAAAILCIPLPSSEIQDTFVWHFTEDGCYSEKSAYRSIMELVGRKLMRLHRVARKNFGNCVFLQKLSPLAGGCVKTLCLLV